MSLIDKLMSIDKGAFAKNRTKSVKSKNLSNIFGEDIMVEVKALDGDQYMDIATRLVNADGSTNISKTYDVNALLVVEGLVSPSLKDGDLQKHFGCATPKELAKVLFRGSELTELAGEITNLSGFGQNDTEVEEQVKN